MVITSLLLAGITQAHAAYCHKTNTLQLNRHNTIGVKNDGTVVVAGTVDPDYLGINYTGWTDIASIHGAFGLKKDGTVKVNGADQQAFYSKANGWQNIVKLTHTMSGGMTGLKKSGTVVTAIPSVIESWVNLNDIQGFGWYDAGLKKDGTLKVEGPAWVVNEMSTWTNVAEISYLSAVRTDGTVYISDSLVWAQSAKSWTGIAKLHYIETYNGSLDRIIGIKTDGTVVTTLGDYSNWGNIAMFSGTTYLFHFVLDYGLKPGGTLVANFDPSTWPAIAPAFGWTNLTYISTYVFNIAGLKNDGTVVATGGDNGRGQLNVSHWADIAQPTCFSAVPSIPKP